MLIKSAKEIAQIKKGGQIISRILAELKKVCRPGISTLAVDLAAEKMIIEAGGKPSFKDYASRAGEIPFPGTICASLNHELVHGVPHKNRILKNGDIFSIDIGMEWPAKGGHGYYTDTAITVPIGEVSPKIKKLLGVTREALEVGMKAVKPGNTVADIGLAIEEYVKSQGKYSIIRDLVGHGVGTAVHEDPPIPNFYDQSMERYKLRPGMVIAIEPMIALGNYNVRTAKDGWTIEMADRSLCAHFEHTLVVTKNGHEVLTRRPKEKEENF
ncbi:MAG: type I methionyl aminopeptidase [Patescibacteria group bacterium]